MGASALKKYIVEEKLNIFKKTLLFLQSYSKTRFGSGAIGFLIAGFGMWYGFVENLRLTVTSLQNENKELKKTLNDVQNKMIVLKEEVRNELKAEQREYLEFTYDYMQKVQENISNTNIKKSKEIEKLEEEIQKRKEVLK